MTERRGALPAASAAVLTAVVLGIVQLKVARPMLIAERFAQGGGWVEVGMLAVYAAWAMHQLGDEQQSPRWRRRIWALFSLAFFAQLMLGLAGFETFLMTGRLHVPVPAMIVGGPLFRGYGLFMPMLFTVTVVLVGPAWCSYLCYIGAWDSGFAQLRKRPAALPDWSKYVRVSLLVGVIGGALGLRAAGIANAMAATAGIAFGIAGVLVMAVWSRRSGCMVHCVAYCPMGWLATVVGKVSPFRLRIRPECTGCGACTTLCRYNALSAADIRERRPGWSCTLCGDCLRACRERFIDYRLFGLRADRARTVFLVLVVSLHATFLGVARI